MADQQQPVIIIRKKKRGGHEAHHGGAWKVAYADFVTAMMSFFLLLWLLNVTTDVQRRGIADYFAPANISKSDSGAGGMFGGQTITTEGAEISDQSPPSVQNVTIPTVGKGEEGDEDTIGKTEGEGNATEGPNAKNANNQGSAESGTTSMPKDAATVAAAMQSEEAAFKQAEDLLKQAIAANPELQQFANQIIVDRTPEGLRIQIIDRDKFSMFPSGGAVPYERGVQLLTMIGKVISRMPNKISVTGHTDGTPFLAGSGNDNWTLSTARANISRAYLVKGGVDEAHVARVSGLADRDPYVPNDPKDPRNRRISIVLLRQSLAPVNTEATPPPAAAAASKVH